MECVCAVANKSLPFRLSQIIFHISVMLNVPSTSPHIYFRLRSVWKTIVILKMCFCLVVWNGMIVFTLFAMGNTALAFTEFG